MIEIPTKNIIYLILHINEYIVSNKAMVTMNLAGIKLGLAAPKKD